jgi:release factor glutamine methyltransferase
MRDGAFSAFGRDLIAQSGIVASEARSLLAFVLDTTRESLIAQPRRQVCAEAASRFRELCARRRAGEPIAYLLGEREFFGRLFRVDHSVLVPRPETECLVEAALQALQGLNSPSVLDLGTGCGCIAITVALERPDAEVTATDASERALEVARTNAVALGARVAFIHADWCAPQGGRFDLIASNPPYVAADDPHLAELRYEPREALTDGGDGLACLRAVIRQAPARLDRGGTLLVEHGYDQGAAVRAMMIENGFSALTLTDLAGVERVCQGRRP